MVAEPPVIFSVSFSLFRISSLAFPLLQKDVQWSFPVFHIQNPQNKTKQTNKNKTQLQTTYTALVRASFLQRRP